MIKVLFFGIIADKLQKHEQQLRITQPICLADLLQQLGCTEMQPLLLAVNQEQVHDLSTMIQDGDEVALMPPFSGG